MLASCRRCWYGGPTESHVYHATKREVVFATHCKPDMRGWAVLRVAEAAAREARARGFNMWEAWTVDDRLIGSVCAADDLAD